LCAIQNQCADKLLATRTSSGERLYLAVTFSEAVSVSQRAFQPFETGRSEETDGALRARISIDISMQKAAGFDPART
jgi:hypothetical protein